MAWLYPGTEDPWAAAFDPSYWVLLAQVMHKLMGTDTQVEGIPSGKHQRDLQGPPQLCVCPPNAWNPAAISCTLAWKASYKDQECICLALLGGLCFSQWILQGVSCRSC